MHLSPHVRRHDAGDFLHDRHDDAIAELTVSLRITDRYLESVREAHQAGAFAWRQASRPFVPALCHTRISDPSL